MCEVEDAGGPARPPEADRVGMKVETGSGLDVGEGRLVVQQQDQFGTLTQVRRGSAVGRQQPSLDDELGGEARLVMRAGAGPDICPRLTGRYALMSYPLPGQPFTATATLQLFVPMTT